VPLTARTTPPGLRLSLLYSEVDGSNPAVNAVYRVLAICMFGIGLYEIKLPELDERSKVIAIANPGLCVASWDCNSRPESFLPTARPLACDLRPHVCAQEYYSKAFVMYLLPVGLCFGYDAIQVPSWSCPVRVAWPHSSSRVLSLSLFLRSHRPRGAMMMLDE
jgi:hypothetical protein